MIYCPTCKCFTHHSDCPDGDFEIFEEDEKMADQPGDTPMKLTISGRGKLTSEARVDQAGVTIRIDDDANAAFWAEVRLTREQLAELLASSADYADALDFGESLESGM